MLIVDKKEAVLPTRNYVSDCKNDEEWCKHCIYFGSLENAPYWLCAKNYLEITRVNYCGHCDRFSTNKKINLVKYWFLKNGGFHFQNKVR